MSEHEDEEMTDEETEFALRLGGGSDVITPLLHKNTQVEQSREHVFALDAFMRDAPPIAKILASFEEVGKVTIVVRYSDSTYGIATFEPEDRPVGSSGMNEVKISRSHAEMISGLMAKDIRSA